MRLFSQRSKQPHGFTLMELMIAISIIAIIATIGFTSYSQSQVYSRDSRRKQDLNAIASALELYFQANKRYPWTESAAGPIWEYSTDSPTTNWIHDAYYVTAPPPALASQPVLSPNYINTLPLDPKNNASPPWTTGNYSYAYYSNTWGTNCTKGRHFILMARLENVNDADSYGKKQPTICGVTYATWSATVPNEAYLVYSNIHS